MNPEWAAEFVRFGSGETAERCSAAGSGLEGVELCCVLGMSQSQVIRINLVFIENLLRMWSKVHAPPARTPPIQVKRFISSRALYNK